MKKEDSGVIKFAIMCVLIFFLFIVCIVLPLASANFSKQPYALPLMATGLALPYVFFFVFGGIALAEKRKKK